MKKILFCMMTTIALLILGGCQEIESPLDTVPNITTATVEQVKRNCAQLTGEISSNSSRCWFLVSTSEDMSDAQTIMATTSRSDMDSKWFCYASIDGLQSGTNYYVALCATDGRSEVRGNVVSFITPSYLKIESVFTADGKPYTGDVLGVYLADANQQVFAKYGNMKALGRNETGYELDHDYFTVTEPTTVYAYIPYNYNQTSNIESLDQVFVDADGYYDYQYGSCIVTEDNPNANIKMQSAMAKLQISLGVDKESMVDYYDVRSVALRNVNATADKEALSIQGTLDLTTGNIKPTFIEGHDGIVYERDFSISKIENRIIEMYVIPTQFEDGELEFEVDICYPQTVKISVPAASWEKGKTYDISLNVKAADDSESLTNIQGEKIYMGFNDFNGKPLYWSSWNLGATSPEDYGGLYGWADPTGRKRSTNLNDYPSANPPQDISGTEYDIARQMWGTGWRIPSNNEMWRLSANSDKEWVTVNGVTGVRYTSKINGHSIFFPVAPIRTGSSIVQGTQSYYWLNAINEKDKTMAGTFYLDTYWENAWPTAGKERYLGLPIRPVWSN